MSKIQTFVGTMYFFKFSKQGLEKKSKIYESQISSTQIQKFMNSDFDYQF